MSSVLLLDGRALLDADQLLGAGLAERRASFELSFDRMPPHMGFLVVCGLETALEALRGPLVTTEDLDLAMRAKACSQRLATRLQGRVAFDVDAVPDGTLGFARTPLAVVEGPLVEVVVVAALLRSAIARGTSIATRTARLHLAGGGDSIIDGTSALQASPSASRAVARAAYVGGASATTCPLASADLGVPFRAAPRIQLRALGVGESDDGSPGGGWGSYIDDVLDLGPADDEEAMLAENKRLERSASGWIARGLDMPGERALRAQAELVALESDGAWTPRRGARGRSAVIPGRKMVARYANESGRAVTDVVHLTNERMTPPKTFGAATLAPLARPVIRGGHALDGPEAAGIGRERAITARTTLPTEVLRLRAPASYPVRFSEGVDRQRA